MADSLTILRGVLLEGKLPTIEGDDFILGRYRFNKNTLTAFKGSTGSNYNLGTVYFLHSNRTLNHGAYILAAARNNVNAVAFNDKKELLQYLDGGEISSSIVFDSLPSTSVPSDITTSTTGSDNLASVQQDSTSISNLESQSQQHQQAQSQQQTSTASTTTTSTTTSTQEPDHQTFQSSTTTTSTTSYTQELDQQDDYIYGEDMNTDTYEDSQFNQKIDPLILNGKEFSATQIKDKQLFAEKIDSARNINSRPETSKTEDSYLQEINQKRKNPSEKSSFVKADEEVTRAINDREKKSSDKISILQSSIPFTNITNSYKKFKLDEEEEKRRKSRPQQQQISTPTNGNSPKPTQVPKNRTPIIIVPSSLTAPISLFNVLEFIQSSKFRPTLEKKTEMAAQNIMKPSIITFDRITSQKVTYEIIDNIKNLKEEDWGRVAAAFVQGEAWQFKDWRWSNPTDLFSHIKGFYVRFDDMNIPDAVKSWDVKVLKISKVKRHLDQTAQVEFWNAFDEFVSSKKPYLKH